MNLFLGVLFGAIGSGYVVYGKRQRSTLFLITGCTLIVYPYLIASATLVLVVGVCLAAIPVMHANGWF